MSGYVPWRFESGNPYGCATFCRAPGAAICPRCEPALYAQFHPSAPEGSVKP